MSTTETKGKSSGRSVVYRLADNMYSALANGRVIIARLGKWLICVNLLSESSRLNLKSIIQGMWKILNNGMFLIQICPQAKSCRKARTETKLSYIF